MSIAEKKWKPGDVALVRLDSETEVRAVMTREGWRTHKGTYYDLHLSARPLVVIDAEDREQAVGLLAAYHRLYRFQPIEPNETQVDRFQTALREFANPRPPRIDEPGTWGVVEASCPHSPTRREWVHHPDGNWWPAFTYSSVPERTPLPDAWEDLIDPTLVREGVAA